MKQIKLAAERQPALFPVKLRQMIEDVTAEGREHLIHFTSDGMAITFSNPTDLEEHLLPKYFVSDAQIDNVFVRTASYGLVLLRPLSLSGAPKLCRF